MDGSNKLKFNDSTGCPQQRPIERRQVGMPVNEFPGVYKGNTIRDVVPVESPINSSW